MAQRFEAAALSVSGQPVPIASGIDHITASAEALFSMSATGRVLAYRTAVRKESRLTWLNPDGSTAGTIGPEKDYTTDLQIAPNGRQAVGVIPDSDSGNR